MSITPIEEDTRFLRKTISDLNEEIEHLTMLQNLGRQIIFKFDFKQIVDIFLDIVKEFVNYHSCILYLFQEDSRSYRAERFRGVSEKDLKNYQPDDEIIDWVLKEGRWTHIHLSFLKHSNPKIMNL